MFGKLPDAYTQHPTYLRLFPGSVRSFIALAVPPLMSLDRVSSKRAHLLCREWSIKQNTQYLVGRYGRTLLLNRYLTPGQVYFKMNESDLVIRCHQHECEGGYEGALELIPDYKLTSILPRSLIRDHVHWYNTKTHIVEVRALTERWTPNLEKNWSTAFKPNGRPTLSRPQGSGVQQFLISPTHELSRAIYDVFSPLEPNIFDFFITFRSTDHRTQPLSISLPRFNLTFSVTKQGDLSCLSHRGFIVDSNEDIGTLYGLSTKLVLCRPSSIGRERKLIVPIGSITPHSTGANHPTVSIDVPGDAVSVGYRVYGVDELLGRLREATFSDRFYLLYLHALTSHQLVDPLTKRTGTEEALEGLKRASSFSFQTLCREEVALLQYLGKLTPHRSLYSRQTKTMQTVQRHTTLPSTLEHHDFAAAAQNIWSHWQAIRVLYPGCNQMKRDANEEFLPGYQTEEHKQLTRRAATRNLFYAPSGSEPPNSRANDRVYTPRDCMGEPSSGHRESLAFGMAKLVQEWPASLDVTAQLPSDIEGWGGVEARQPMLNLDYCTIWVESSLRTVWRSLYDLFRTAQKERDQIKLTVLLGTLAYRHPREHHLHKTLLAFATCPHFAQLASPSSGDLDFSYGGAPTEFTLRSIVTSNAVRFEQSTEHQEMFRFGWTDERERNFQSQYRTRLQQQTNECVTVLLSLLHQNHVPPFVLYHFDLLDKEKLRSELDNTFKHCYDNR
jgi:hypothetical protein